MRLCKRKTSQGTHNGFDLGQFLAPGEMFNCPGFKLTLVIKKPDFNSPTMPEIGIGVSVSPRWHAIMGWYPWSETPSDRCTS